MRLDSALRSRMEVLLSTPFSLLASGTDVVNLGGQACTLYWTVTPRDLDGDGAAEANAREITVSLEGHSLTTLVVDSQGEVGKI